jgi:hypothetical protein
MSYIKVPLLIIFVIVFAPVFCTGQVMINEVLSANLEYLDEDGDPSDWIELYNFSDNTIDLTDWVITDRENNPKWKLEESEIKANDYLLIWASGKSKTKNTFETLINRGDIWKYTVPNQPIDLSWIDNEYNDDNWLTGPSGFGYADEDDATIIPSGTSSVFMRKQFLLTDLESIESIYLDIDYDDAFVAYLNGVEIARSNISDARPEYNQFSITDHEANIHRGMRPEQFEIDRSYFQEGQNVIAIQAHNVSSTSSDMTIIPFLTVKYNQAILAPTEVPEILGYASNEIHTNFKISSDETIFLYNSDGNEVSRLKVQNAPTDVSTGINPNSQDTVLYDPPTPLAINSQDGLQGFLTDEVIFSHDGGLVDELQLTLSTSGQNNIILYTTDSSEPNTSSNVYSSPITISQNTVIRARIFKQGYVPSRINSRAYILNRDHELPVMSLITEPDNFFSGETGIYVLGPGFFPDFPYEGSNIWEDWERPIHVSLYEDDDLKLNFNGGTKIFGGWSRAHDQRSLSIFARSRYGTSEIDYPLFPQRPYDTYQAFILRNSGNDFLSTNIRDAALTSLMDGSGIETQAYRPVVTYINTAYWGIFNMREKMNEHYLASRYNIDADEIDILGPYNEVIQGSNSDFRTMMLFLESNTLDSEENYQIISNQIDIDNFIKYNVAQIYFDNRDWPVNNNKQWRPKNGKWRWMLYDTDFGFGIWNPFAYQNNTLAFALDQNGPEWPNPPSSTLLLRRLIGNISFRNRFINQFADELNSRFIPQNVENHIEEIADGVASEISDHYNRWGGSFSDHITKVDEMIQFGNLRPSFIKNQIKNEFNLPARHQITLQVTNPTQGFIKVNSLTLSDPLWKGEYFQSVPIKVTAIPKHGYAFSHWIGAAEAESSELTIDMNSDLLLTAVFIPSNDEPIAIINEINYNSNNENDAGDWIELYNPNNVPIDLSGWLITDSDLENGYNIPDNTILQGEEFLVLTRDKSKFDEIHTEVQPVLGDLPFGLSSNGESIKLYSADGSIMDSVEYLPISPWPHLANGQGYTLELKSPSLDNTQAENWTSFKVNGSPGEINTDLTAVSENNKRLPIKLSPNPFLGDTQIAIKLDNQSHVTAKLYNIEGQLITTMLNKVMPAGEHTLSNDMSDLESGIYLLVIKIGDKKETHQWIKL